MAKPIEMDYFTDPYCAWSWAFEQTLQAILKVERGRVRVRFRALPLIRDLKAAGKTGDDIASAWERVSSLTGAPIDASLWRTRPPQSTLSAIRAQKAAETLGAGAEMRLLRALRPLLMTQARSAEDAGTLAEAAHAAGLDLAALEQAMRAPDLDARIEEDEAMAQAHGIVATPGVLLRNAEGDRIMIQGPRDEVLFQRAIEVLRVEDDIAAAALAVRATPLVAEPAEATLPRQEG